MSVELSMVTGFNIALVSHQAVADCSFTDITFHKSWSRAVPEYWITPLATRRVL